MKITIKWLEKHNACNNAVEEYKKRKLKLEGIDLVKLLITEKRYDWADWLIVRIMRYKQYVEYAIYAAKQVIDIFEKKYPDDKRPRQAIETAKKCLKNSNIKNKIAAAAAAADVTDTAYACAAVVSYAAAAVAADAASYAYAASYVDVYNVTFVKVRNKMKLKILKYGLKLLGE